MPDTLAPADSAARPSTPTAAPSRSPRRWLWWLLGGAALLVALALIAQHFLDPWLQRTLQEQVSKQTQGQYRLEVGRLETSLWQRAVRLRRLRLRSAAVVADTLPRIRLDVARLHLTGVGLLALLRKGTVPIDSLVLDSARIEVLALASRPTKNAGKPLHERLPFGVKGLEIRYIGLLHAHARYLPPGPTTAQVERADVSAREVLISPAGAADTQRLGYAAAWTLRLRRTQARLQGHALTAAALRLSTADRRAQLDSLRIRPAGAVPAATPRVALALPRLRLTGIDAFALQRRQRFVVDSLLVHRPQLTFTPATAATDSASGGLGQRLRRLDVAHLAVHQGYVRVAGTAAAPVVANINVAATSLRLGAGAQAEANRVFFAKAWKVALGPSRATVAGHALALGSLQLSTAAGTVDLRAVSVRPPAPGAGQRGAVRVGLRLPSLALRGLDAGALQQRRFLAKSLVISQPKLDFTPPAQAPPPVWKLLAKFLTRTDLAQVRVTGAEVQVGGLRHSPAVRGLNLTGRAIRIDSLAALEPRRIAYARSWQGNSGLVAAPFDPPYYRATGQKMRFDTDAQTLQLERLALTPKYSAVGLNLKKGYQAPAITIKINALTASGLDFAGLVRNADVRAALVTVQRPWVSIASDGRGPINPNWSKVSPEEMRKLPMIVDIRRLDIKGGDLYSRYRSPLTPEIGTMSINRFNGSFFNLSNDPARQTAATPLTGSATTYLQNRCRLDAQVSMHLLDPRGRHRVWGAFGPGPFSMLNSMTVPTRLVRFKSGEVRRMRFDLRADRQGIRGTAWTEYSGLQMTLLRYKEDEEEVQKSLLSRVKSKVVNVAVIRDQNPRKGGKFVTGDATSTREPRFSVFTLWRQGIVSGLFHNVGVPQKIAQKLSESKDEAPLPK